MEAIYHVTVQDMLRARDERAARQADFINRHHAPLISFTMNIAGSIKNDAQIQRAFAEGRARIVRVLRGFRLDVLEEAQTIAPSGCEALWAVRAEAGFLKRQMCLIEEADALGRLFDIDVIDENGVHLSRNAERACLICGGPVRICARSRAHSGEALFAKAHAIIEDYFQKKYFRTIGEQAQRALLYEALTTPKPGLVDCENSGAHRDMDLLSFADSACALRSYFERCAALGAENAGHERLQQEGLAAEEAMLEAARANTHKGAIFSLGILCYAAGRCSENATLESVLECVARLGSSYLMQLQTAVSPTTGGEQQYARYGLTGARGEAASGFQTVRQIALPALEKGVQQGKTLCEAGLDALLELISRVKDSNIIRRAGMDGQEWASAQAEKLLRNGYTTDDLRRLNDRFVKRNISPGGSADLLALSYFLYFRKHPDSH